MPYSLETTRILTAEPLVSSFFQASEGDWCSRRRYYTLKNGDVQEVVSYISIRFLEAGSEELQRLHDLHELPEQTSLICGAQVSWESDYIHTDKKPVEGSTLFGVHDTTLYRDRGFATSKPVTADFVFRDPRTMVLKTAYSGSSFEEEIKMIGDATRTRQTIISRAGEEIMIGQYLEQRR
ncbi:MAG: phycobiliprotein lyase [Cyanobacteria bacterium P01_C01_bin.120]